MTEWLRADGTWGALWDVSSPDWLCGMLNIQHNNSETNYWPEQSSKNTACADSVETLMSNTAKTIQIFVSVWSTWAHTDVCVYLRRLFATRRGGSAAGGGQGGGAGLWGALLTGWGHLIQAVFPGRVGLHAAGGRRVLDSKHIKLY